MLTRVGSLALSHQKDLEWTPDRISAVVQKTGPSCTELVRHIMANQPHPEGTPRTDHFKTVPGAMPSDRLIPDAYRPWPSLGKSTPYKQFVRLPCSNSVPDLPPRVERKSGLCTESAWMWRRDRGLNRDG